MSSGANDQANDDLFAALGEHGCRIGCDVSKLVLQPKIFQPPHNGVISTVKELSKTFWRAVRVLATDLHQFNHNVQSHASLQIFS